MALPLIYDNVTLKYGKKTVLEGFSHSFPDGKRSVIMGQSGCGKTSLLRLAAGLIPQKNYTGTINTGGARISYQFQEPRLFPWLTVAENILLPIEDKAHSLRDSALRSKVKELLSELGLEDILDAYPDSLSGGMAQRVSLARALTFKGELLLLDEPFRGLDGDTRELVINTVRHHTEGATLILVTHDLTEAETLCNGDLLKM